MPSQPTSGALNTEHNEAQREHTDGEDRGLSNTPTLLRPNVDIEDVKIELSHGALVNLNTDTSADDKFVKLEECTSPLQPGDVMDILETDTNDALYAMYTTLKEESLSDVIKFLMSKGTDLNEENFIGRIPLHSAAIDGNTEVIEYLIQQGSDVNKEDTTGWTPFHAAIQYGHLDVIKYLVTTGAKQTSFCGIPPLHVASLFGHLDVVKYFISKGADVNEGDAKCKIPLHGAASQGHMKVMECLIQHGSDVNKADAKGLTPFNAAVRNGQLEAVKYLLTGGAKQTRYNGMTPLFIATQFGHLDIVQFLIDKGADVNEGDAKGMIPLHDAASRGHIEVIEYLIQQGSDVNKGDAKGWTPFNAAVQYGHLEAVKYLLIGGANQNKYDGMTPLHAAAQFGHLDIVTFFMDKGANVNEEDIKGMIPLHDAASGGHIEVIEYLIQHGSDVNKGDAKGWTPFNTAVQYGHLEAVKYLITGGAKQNRYNGMTPLYAASQFGHLDIVKFFIDKGADVNEENDNGIIPLHGAAFRGHMNVMEYLIQQGSDVNRADAKGLTPFNAAVQEGYLEEVKYLITKGAKQNRCEGITPLYAATYFGHLHIVEYFISKGADVNEVNDKGVTLLHGAAARGHLKVMEYLIQQGSDVNMKDCRGWTPLHAAIINGHLEVVKLLMVKGADSTWFDGLTPLYIPTQFNHIDVVKFLVSNGYNVNDRNECGKSPLHAACYNGNMDIVKVLLHHNANVNEQDHDGWTPLHAAAQEGHQDIVRYLILNGADMNVKDIDGFTPLQAAVDADHLNAIEDILACRGDQDKEPTGDPRSGGQPNLIRRLFVTVSLTDADTQSLTGELASFVDNVEDGNDCNQADIVKRGADELSLKNLPSSTQDGKTGGSEEHSPFIYAKLKCPDKGEQEPMLYQVEATETPVTTNGADCSTLRRPQTWQYNGFDPPNLQTTENDGHPSEEPESRCHSLIDENREMRESCATLNAGKDPPFNGTSTELESFPTNPAAVVHQKLYDGNPVSAKGTPSNSVCNIRTKRRTAVYQCPSILTLVQTLLQTIIALAIILAGSPVLVAGRDITERVTLQAGKPSVVQFNLPRPPNSTSLGYFTLRFKSKPRPFFINGTADVKGFKSPSQVPRFTTSVTDLDTSPCLNLMIDNVENLDEGVYVLLAVWHSFENVRYETIQKEVDVQTPPGLAKCSITLSTNIDYPYEVHCRATTATTTLSCYQNDQRIEIRSDITDDGLNTRGIFWLPDTTHFSCCSHDVTLHLNATTCNDFEWPHIKETTRQIVNTVPTSVTTPTPQVESHTVSGACRQSMLPSMWHFTYLFIYILAFVTI